VKISYFLFLIVIQIISPFAVNAHALLMLLVLSPGAIWRENNWDSTIGGHFYFELQQRYKNSRPSHLKMLALLHPKSASGYFKEIKKL
jgi:hypothetical protein